MQQAPTSSGTTVLWEEQQGPQWKAKKHTFRPNVNVGRVLLEMRNQPNLRNITLTNKE